MSPHPLVPPSSCSLFLPLSPRWLPASDHHIRQRRSHPCGQRGEQFQVRWKRALLSAVRRDPYAASAGNGPRGHIGHTRASVGGTGRGCRAGHRQDVEGHRLLMGSPWVRILPHPPASSTRRQTDPMSPPPLRHPLRTSAGGSPSPHLPASPTAVTLGPPGPHRDTDAADGKWGPVPRGATTSATGLS